MDAEQRLILSLVALEIPLPNGIGLANRVIIIKRHMQSARMPKMDNRPMQFDEAIEHFAAGATRSHQTDTNARIQQAAWCVVGFDAHSHGSH